MTISPTDSLVDNTRGGYRFLTGIAPYSSAVVAMPGHSIVRAILHAPIPYRTGFEIIDRTLRAAGRPRQALCAIELRLPRPLSFSGFGTFNAEYQDVLACWNLLVDDMNPVARTNVAPIVNPPSEPSLYAFAYTTPAATTNESTAHSSPPFVIAGAGDLDDQANLSSDAIVRPGETSADAMVEKASCVVDVMMQRLKGIGRSIKDVTSVYIYTAAMLSQATSQDVQPLTPMLEQVLLPRLGTATQHGLTWFLAHPPIEGLAFEMDMRCIPRQDLILP